MKNLINRTRRQLARLWSRISWGVALEWLVMLLVGYAYSGPGLLDFDAGILQQTGEHNESATLPLLAEVSLWRYHEIPLWNPYMLTGFPHVGDILGHFWNPVSTLSVMLWGGINGMKVSIFISFLLAGIGQWLFAHVMGVRGPPRLWSGLLFMTSGGVALLWRVGWYELLIGMAWFPWCFASLWWALQRRGRASIAIAAVCLAMALSAGGGYYPFYLFASLSVLLAMRLAFATPQERWPQLRRAALTAALCAGLLAVMILPIADGFRYTRREAPPDKEQQGSQPIPYALANYVVSSPEWFNAATLGTAGGWNWFYIGALPLAALALVPLTLRSRPQRRAVLALSALLLFLLAWHANKYTPIHAIYEWLPWLYVLRFPGRLLIVATIPLLALAALGLQHVWHAARDWFRHFSLTIARQGRAGDGPSMSLAWAVDGAFLALLLFSASDVFSVNKGFAFAPRPIEPKSFEALSWLKNYDRDLYYTNIGGDRISWSWTPAAYSLEMPIINFKYNRMIVTYVAQHQPESPFFAKPKYMLAAADQPRPPDATLLRDFEGIGLWYLPDALPFAFAGPVDRFRAGAAITPSDVTPVKVSFDGPNRIIASGTASQASQLVVLVSDYPGWHLLIDGQPAPIETANAYLGAHMLPGEHTYTFSFRPAKYDLGLAISLLTLAVCLGMVLRDTALWTLLAGSLRRAPQGLGAGPPQAQEEVS